MQAHAAHLTAEHRVGVDRNNMEKLRTFIAYLSGIGTAVSTLTLQDWALVVGIATSVGTFLVNWYYKAKRDGRD